MLTTKIFADIKNLDECLKLQHNLDNVYKWCLHNNLSLNIEKCNVLTFCLKHCPIYFNYNIQNSTLSRVTQFRDLGVVFDGKMSFAAHIDATVNGAMRALGFIIRNSKHFDDLETVKLLYFAFVRSKLEYASVIWSPGYSIYSALLESVQRRFLKFLAFKTDGTYPPIGFSNQALLDRFTISSLAARREYTSLTFLVKLVNKVIDCPAVLSQLNFNIPRESSRQGHTFYLPTPRTNVLKFSPVYNMCDTYNKSAVI